VYKFKFPDHWTSWLAVPLVGHSVINDCYKSLWSLKVNENNAGKNNEHKPADCSSSSFDSAVGHAARVVRATSDIALLVTLHAPVATETSHSLCIPSQQAHGGAEQ